MKKAKKILKIVLKSVLFFVGFVVLYLLSSFACKYITTNNDYVSPEQGTKVFIISNGVHADICFSLKDNIIPWKTYFKPEDFVTLKKEAKYISFGWGDKGFFLNTPTWADLTASTALKAGLLPSPTAMHVSYLDFEPQTSETTKSFVIDNKTLKKMEDYIMSYIQLKNQKPQLIDCCRYPNVHDNFYEANGSYHMFRTCNVWTNQVIINAGVKTSVWTPFDSAILYQFE